MFKVFTVNPGSTSTKIGMFSGSISLFEKVIRHDPEELKKYSTAASQFGFRFNAVKESVEDQKESFEFVDAFAGRGGLLKPLKGGTYIIDSSMLKDLQSSKFGDHASNLGAIISFRLGKEYNKPAYIVNPPVVDEMMDEARYSGIPEIKRRSAFHALNHKAVAMRAAAEAGIAYECGRFIVAHLGGGISVGAHDRGRVIDVNDALEEGPFSPERAGSLPVMKVVEMCFSGRYTREEINKMLVGKGGIFAYTGTTDIKKLTEGIQTNQNFKKLLGAMAYRISKEICANAAALYGKVDRVIITGGLAYSQYIVGEIKKRVSFLGPVVVYPGEDELSALAEGVLRVLDGREAALSYTEGGV